MSIQTGEGPIRVDADDAQLTYRGTTIAVKVRVIAWPVVLGVIKATDGSWAVKRELTGDLFASDPPGGGDIVEVEMASQGGPLQFVRNVILPALNAWLREVWPPVSGGGGGGGTPTGTPIEQLGAAVAGIRFTILTDGTVQATV